VTRAAATILVLLIAGCASGPPAPVALQPGTPCTHCRMTVLDAKLAAQLVGAGEEPRFFDDIGCLAAYLGGHPSDGATAYVADHASGQWIEASHAVYGRDPALATPMNSHLFAHASAQARAADTTVTSDRPLTYAEAIAHANAEGSRGR
jgi:copper chaperone NosL